MKSPRMRTLWFGGRAIQNILRCFPWPKCCFKFRLLAENERSFSSASFILDQRRTWLDIDNIRREHRIRRALCVGRTPAEKLEFSNGLIERFAVHVADARALKAAQEAAQQAARLLNPHRWSRCPLGTVIIRLFRCPLRRLCTDFSEPSIKNQWTISLKNNHSLVYGSIRQPCFKWNHSLQ